MRTPGQSQDGEPKTEYDECNSPMLAVADSISPFGFKAASR